jgi:hypothetical protein
MLELERKIRQGDSNADVRYEGEDVKVEPGTIRGVTLAMSPRPRMGDDS